MCSLSHLLTRSLSTVNTPTRWDPVTVDGPTLTRHCHQGPGLTSGFTCGAVHSVGLDTV